MRQLSLVLAIFCVSRLAPASTVWIDTDVSVGSPVREVDDAFALVFAFHSPEIRIAGVSTTFGNAPLGHTTQAAQDLVRSFGGDAGLTDRDVYPGARSPNAIGDRTAASDALAAVLKKREVIYIALGPLTNLATFLRLHPKQAHRIERVIFVGGQVPGTTLAFGPRRSFRIHDANVFKDPAAVEAVLRSNIPLTLVPIATASNLLLDERDLHTLEQSSGAANYLSRRSRIWLWFWRNVVKTKGGPIFDAVAITPATKPELLSLEKRYAKMDETGNLLVMPRLTNGSRPVRFCTSFAPETKDFVMRRLITRRSRE
jgi:inosine-uridine nucleoside N-ribohydrolase